MTLKKRISSIGRTAKISLAAVALVGGLAATAPATAAAVPAAIQSASSIQASYSCTYLRLSDYRADLNCTVYSGTVRMRAYCSDGRVITRIIGPGSWYLVFDCSPAKLNSIWIDTFG